MPRLADEPCAVCYFLVVFPLSGNGKGRLVGLKKLTDDKGD